MAQTSSERRAAQRRLAKDLKAGKRNILTPAQKGQVKAAQVLKYRMADWNAMPPAERKRIRDFVSGRGRSIKQYAAHRLAGDAEDYYPDDYRDDWETWEWDMYKEAVGA
jgi:hypothetical protein